MKKASTLFLKSVILLVGIAVFALCVFGLPSMYKGGSAEFPIASQTILLVIIGLYATAIPFFIALWQTFKLLNYIDHNTAFSEASVKVLKKIKYCATIIGILYLGGVPFLIPIAEADDTPGMVIIGMAISLAPIAVAVFATVLQKLLQNALDIKSENELTV